LLRKDFLADRRSSPPEEAERREQLARLADPIKQLPVNQCDALIRHRLLRRPIAAVTAGLGCSESAVAGLLR
jgi:hypothetical protein